MKWIKGFLIFGMVMLAHSTISINDVEANAKKTDAAAKKPAKSAKKDKKNKSTKAPKGKKEKKGGKANKSSKKVAEAKPEKKSLFSSFSSGLKSLGSKIASGAKAAKDKAAAALACRAGKGEAPGKKLYAMASTGTALTDAHIVAAHTTAAPKAGRKK